MISSQSSDHQENSKSDFLAHILALGHEAYQQPNFEKFSQFIFTQSAKIAPFGRSVIFSREKDGSPKILAMRYSSDPNKTTAYQMSLTELIEGLKLSDQHLLIDVSNSPKEILKKANVGSILILPFTCPHESKRHVYWYMEYSCRDDQLPLNALTLLSRHYAQAFWYLTKTGKSPEKIGFKRQYPIKWIALIGVLLMFFCLAYLRVPMRTTAPFTIKSNIQNTAYSPFTGHVENIRHKSGDRVNKGEIIISLDRRQWLQEEKQLKRRQEEILLQSDLARKEALIDDNMRIQFLIYEKQLQQLKIALESNSWHQQQCFIRAPIEGVLYIDNEDEIRGRFFQAGEKVFQVLQPEYYIASIAVPEREAALLKEEPQISIFADENPSKAFEVKIVEMSQIPRLNEQGLYAYEVKTNTATSDMNLGATGTAVLKGQKVSLAYYLFRNVVLWWRRL